MLNEQMSVERLKGEVLPAIFRDSAALEGYGAGESSAGALHEFSNLMDGASVAALALAGKIGEIGAKLADADPRRIAGKPSWFERLLGREVERKVRCQVARKVMDETLDEAQGDAQRARDTLRALDGLIATTAAEAGRLRGYIQAGREFLDENPQAGIAAAGALEFDRPRERFARKLANLATLLSAHERSVTQMQLKRAHVVDMLDRFNEASTVLVPIWRQLTLALMMVRDAAKTNPNQECERL